MRDVEQVMRFYLISKRINCRTIKSLMDRPEWSPLLKLCVERLKTYKEFGIKRCKEIKKEIREKRFKFKYNPFDLMSTGEEELPRGTMIDWFEMIEVVTEIENYLKNI